MISEGLSMRSISKEFPGVKALDQVDFNLGPGEIHALVGANGAGKSTLMKVLSGGTTKSDGEIYIDGELVHIESPIDAKGLGIVTVYQEVDTALIPHLTVAENIMMDHVISKKQSTFMNWKWLQKRAAEALEKLNLDIDINKQVQDLSLSEKQMVLIGRAVFHDAKYLLLDEPTAPLSVDETEKLFSIVQSLQKRGVSIVFISHRLEEVFQICQNVTVLRDGRLVGNYAIENESIDSIVEKMLGRKLEQTFPKQHLVPGDTLLEARELCGAGGIHNCSFQIKAGEIIGISGLVGAGKTELLKLLFGDSPHQGELQLKGIPLKFGNPSQAQKAGLALVPEERRKEGVLVHESIETNLTLPSLSEYCFGPFLRRKNLLKQSEKIIQQVGIKTPSAGQKVANLSGGNQQKVSIGKWLDSQAEVFLFDEPTKGVDVGSKAEIYRLIGELAALGKGIIYASCEFSEILGLTDRVYVMYNGTIAASLITKDSNEEELLYYATGGGAYERSV